MKRAGLPLSVGQASIAVRIMLGLVFAATAILCIGGGMFIATIAVAARVIAIGLVVPIGLIGAIAVAFILAPHSRFGDWLDRFVPRLREPRVAIAVTAGLWLLALLLVSVRQ
ncbi:MAG TPA: hypothetical protein VE010_16225 [Thermoanaerobaculia bacterium]|nr:hypothetical protein [Thermoanaerobaculia bacterium]